VEVFLDSEDQLGEAFELLERLCKNVKIQRLKQLVSVLWIEAEEAVTISEHVSDSTHRIALSILRSSPNAKGSGDIQSETGLSHGYVSNILAGRRGGVGDWFAQEGDCWKLSQMGLTAIAEMIAPIYLQVSGEED
jgi:hypothetical protein